MGHENADVCGKLGDVTCWAEEGDAVQDVQWQPTHREEEDHQGQRLGQLQLLLIVALAVARSCSAAVELPPDQSEDLAVQSDHDGQRGHHPPEEVEVHHVVHSHDRGELADNVIRDTEVFQVFVGIPSNHRNQSGEKGEDPTQENGNVHPPLSHNGAVPTQRQRKGTAEVCLIT